MGRRSPTLAPVLLLLLLLLIGAAALLLVRGFVGVGFGAMTPKPQLQVKVDHYHWCIPAGTHQSYWIDPLPLQTRLPIDPPIRTSIPTKSNTSSRPTRSSLLPTAPLPACAPGRRRWPWRRRTPSTISPSPTTGAAAAS